MTLQTDGLGTARLSLRKPTTLDAAAVLAILSDPRVVEHNPSDQVADLPRVEALITRWLKHWDVHGFGYYCVFDDRTGHLVGNCGIRRMTVHDQQVLNLMYRFAPTSWGQGYATEAANATVQWARQRLPGQVILARIRPAHLASQYVASKVGLRRDPTLDDIGEDGLDWAFTNRPGVMSSRWSASCPTPNTHEVDTQAVQQ